MIFYRAVRFFLTNFVRVAWRLRVRGAERIPTDGACILAASHRSMMDIPFLGCTTRRRIRFMGKRSVFEWPVIGGLFFKLGSFAVERDGDDRAALRAALTILERDGEPMAVYPEGTRRRGGKIAELQPGAAYLAMRAGVPIVPVGIAGTEEILHEPDGTQRRLPRLSRVAIVVGDPIYPPARQGAVKRAVVDELTARLRDDLQRLFDDAYALRG